MSHLEHDKHFQLGLDPIAFEHEKVFNQVSLTQAMKF